ncbi:unnamed protein product [Penicillium salamii]|nr:unnamed protein product [Penicillium salamii]CAG8329139.1 unnamed protein product [Penicillium salamii]
MPANSYCPFCGIILLPDPYWESPPSSQAQPRPWYAEARGIYPTDIPGSVGLTGLGIIQARKNLCAPSESHRSYIGEDLDALDVWRISELSDHRWCFAFHDSCWNILLLRLGIRDTNPLHIEAAILRPLFHQLYSIPCPEGSVFKLGHDYGGAAQTHVIFGQIKPIDLSSEYYADPYAIPSISAIEANIQPNLGSGTGVSLPVEDTSRAFALFQSNQIPALFRSLEDTSKVIRANSLKPCAHVFKKLPAELASEILSYLSFAELLTLRLVCRDFALIATTSVFSQSYWRGRFCIGQEMDFLFLKLIKARNWARIFQGIQVSLKKSLSLINRKRVRSLLEPIAALCDLEAVLRTGPHGYVWCPTQNPEAFQCPDGATSESPVSLQIGNSHSGYTWTPKTDGPLDEGCRKLFYRSQSLYFPHQPIERRIGVSIIKLGTKSFISGINFHDSTSRVIGYRIPSSEEWVQMPFASELREIAVAFRSEGLTGVKFVFEDSSSDWVGDEQSWGIAFGRLTIPETGSWWPHLLAGLDNFKIVLLGLGKTSNRPLNEVTDSFDIQSVLWAPHPPSEKYVKCSPLLPLSESPQPFDPLTNIDFGGPKGVHLGRLTRLTFHMAASNSPLPLTGIEIFLSDGHSFLCGSRSDCELSLFIEGSKGERIDRIDILEESSRYHLKKVLGGLQIWTNFGRAVSFAPLRSRIENSVKSLPDLPSGSFITGLIAMNEGFRTRFTRIGYQAQQNVERFGPYQRTDIVDHDCHHVPRDQVLYEDTFSCYTGGGRFRDYQTYATLKNVRKIQASIDIGGLSRYSNCISGLKIEYFDHPSPAVLGQWFKESDSFELSRGEKVQSLTIRLTPMGFNGERPGMKLGQVTAIQIETTYSRSMTFKSTQEETRPAESFDRQSLQDHYHSDPDSGDEIVAISWILNSHYDRLRAVFSVNTNRPAPVSVPERAPPSDQIQKLYFTRYNRDNGDWETVVAVEAFFRDQSIVGIVFIYPSDRRAKIGSFDDALFRQTVHFPLDSRVVGIWITHTDYEMRNIEFTLELKEQSALSTVSLPLEPLPGSGITFPGETLRRKVWYQPGTPAESYHLHSTTSAYNEIYPPPSRSRLVGISLNCQDTSCARPGALYELEPNLVISRGLS